MRGTLIVVAVCGLLLSAVRLAAQGVAWTGPGPSANVKAFGAVGDLLVGNDGSGSMGASSLSSSQTFTAADMGKTLWIDEAPFPAPTFASNGILVDTGSGAMHCPNGGQFINTATYPIHVYYRVTFINSAGTMEGNASVEGFASIPANPSLTYCVKITSPTGAPTGAVNYRVYFGTDATPLAWQSNTPYSAGQQILDPNGNVETVTTGGTTTNGSQPSWPGVGAITIDHTVHWLNQGPVVPGSGSGLEKLLTGICGGSAGTLLGAGCEIDTTFNASPIKSPPSPMVVKVGQITGVGAGTLSWMGNPLPSAISSANFAWGHDDTAAIISALTSLNNYVDTQSRPVGGSLFFPTSTGCYGIVSNIGVTSTNSQFFGLTGEGSASSKMLGGPGTLPQQPASACVATILPSAGFTFSSDSGMLNAGPVVERLGFLDPFGVTATALKFNMNASTRVINNSFQGYAAGNAIWFNAVQVDDTHLKYNQFIEVSDNVCVSVLSCIIMNNGVTNPAWIERNRCVSSQTGGGRCVQLGPNITPVSITDPVNLGGATNWIVENFALYYPISFESIDQYADYWIGNSNQQTASLQGSGMSIPNIIGGANSGTGLHIGTSVVAVPSPPDTICFDNEVFGGNNALNDVGLFVDPLCDKTLYLGYTVANPTGTPLVEDFGTKSTFWNQELGMKVNAPATFSSVTAAGSIATVQLAAPPSPTITPTGGTTASWSYAVCAKDGAGGSICSSPGSTATGPASLGTSNYNTITWSPVAQAVSYDVWRTAIGVGNSPSTYGLLGNVPATSTLTFRDNNSVAPNPQCTVSADCSPKFNTTGSMGSPINSAGAGFFFSTGIFQAQSIGTVTANGVLGTAAANTVLVTQFYLTSAMTVGQITIDVSTGVSGSKVIIGIYDANGNKLVDSGGINTPTSGVLVTSSPISPPVTLYPGTYYFAQTASNTTVQLQAISSPDWDAFLNARANRVGTCANLAAGGALPKVCFDASHALTTGAVVPVLALFER